MNDGRQLRLKVRDSGIGIPADQLEHIFDRFYRVENSTAGMAAEGTGIGLALVKELVHLMEGSIEVDSQVGKGTTFTILLPMVGVEKKEIPEPLTRIHTREVFDPAVLFPASSFEETTVA